ncbi:endoplasmic reticulum domain-containing protein [Coniochaeta ligniaria NRRL 30616]|uniref:Endoplasmic reticulum domain-containing protein n=1 Tax=Coniochaeta ligniaria NRRL 30616 TaxID=1408157 RepID=A0A1J7J3Q6_9PEZI|nr:endoplasmic reticulum domain-containing protein [Coniochaeta ligniaria NRRL 30616]
MRITTLTLGLLAILTPLSAAWSKEDREIFRLRDELAGHESPEITFYDFLGIKPSASQDEINKAYRKKSRSLHPDKVKQQLAAERAAAAKADAKKSKSGVKVAKQPSQSEVKAAVKRASDRQARLSIVANILRGPGRERYDYFMSNGFPKWKGTEYYYTRYRPGFGTVLVGVFLFAGGAAHYIALYMGWRRQREFVGRYIKYARTAAWGENSLGVNIPGVDGQPVAVAPAREQQMYEDENGRAVPINRKMRRLQEKDARKEADKERVAQGGRRGRKGAAAASKPGSGAATPRAQEGAGPTGSRKRVVAENGKVLVVDSLGDVYLEQEDEEGNVQEFLLDPNEIARPTISDTAVVRLPVWVYQLTVGRVLSKRAKDDSSDEEFDDEQPAEDDEEDSEPGKRTPSTDSAEDFELLDKSVESLGKDTAKASGASQKQGKAGKRKNKKR